MTADELKAIRERLEQTRREARVLGRVLPGPMTWEDVSALLAEVERLRDLMAALADEGEHMDDHGLEVDGRWLADKCRSFLA